MDAFFNTYRGKKVLITGDTGFKGSWLAIWLLELGAEVYGYALPPVSLHDNFVTTGLAKHIQHHDGDVRDINGLKDYFQRVKPDFAFHLAAQPLVLDSYKNPHYTFETNLMGTVAFWEAVRYTSSVRVAINITSDKCYQNNEWIWGYREQDPMGGKDPYSASKGCSELISASYSESFFSDKDKIGTATARAGNVIGGGDWAENRIVPDFFRSLKGNSDLSLRFPNATRPWQHVLEPLSGYLLLASKLFTMPSEYSGAWNFGPLEGNNFTVLELINWLIKRTGKGNVTFSDEPKKNESGLLRLDISKSRSLLEWSPILNFEKTVDFVVDGYLSEIESGANILQHRVQQIHRYVSIGITNNLHYLLG